MTIRAKNLSTAVTSSLLLGLLTLAGCKKPGDDPPQPSVATAPVQAAPYTPPSAEQLSQMVAPIALFPDKLVAQVLAGATYPEQITAADQWLAQNPSLKGPALQNAESGQPWDVSVKSLTAFPNVLDQMANNIQWTTALGQAYANDPNDVMNAIQQMRLRARQAGHLQSSPRLKVVTVSRPAPPPEYETRYDPPPSGEPWVYQGPPVIHAPPETIVIEPAEPDVVYVPHYDPEVVYGAPVRMYPGWTYRQPAYVADNSVATGAITFGIGVLVGAAVSHHDWGWNSWGVNWGGPVRDAGPAPVWHRPAVVYNNTTYVSKSVTVVNRVNNVNVTNNNYRTTNNTNNINNTNINNVNNINNARTINNVATVVNHTQVQRPMAATAPNAPMTIPHFSPHDAVPRPHVQPPQSMQAMHAAPVPQIHQIPATPAGRPPVPAADKLAREEQAHGAQAPHASQFAAAPAAKPLMPEAKPPAHQEAQFDRNQEHLAQQHQRQQAEAKPPAAPPVHIAAATPATPSKPEAHPPMHIAAATPAAPQPKPEARAADHPPPHFAHQEAPVPHNDHAHAVEHPPAPHPDKHAANSHPQDKHDKHDKHEG